MGEASFRKARKQDAKRRSTTARVALLDIWGERKDAMTRPLIERQLGARALSLRIAALEALIRFGHPSQPVLARLLQDESPVVQRALLAAVQRHAATDPRWIGPVLGYYAAAHGLPRADALATLEVLTKGSFGDAPERWREWFSTNRAAIAHGTVAAPQADKKIRGARTNFYRIETPSERILFLLDGSWSLIVPAELEIQRLRHWMHWGKGRTDSREVTHKDVFARELGEALVHLPPRARFGIFVVGNHRNKEDVVGRWPDEGLVDPTKRHRTDAVQFVRDYKYSWINYDVHFALLRVFESADVDTLFLVNTGQLKAGRYLVPEAIVADFKRRNRFRRFVVHAIRICDTGPETTTLLEGLAKSSGGAYRWAKRPPPAR